MNAQVGSIAVCSGLSLLCLCYVFFWRYRSFRVDTFRQEMFALRDELFDDAVAGIIPFSHPAYGVLRRTMNGFIRFGHRLTLWHVIVTTLMVNNGDIPEEEYSETLNRASADLSADTRQRIDGYKTRMNKAAFKHLLLISPEVLAPIIIYLFARIMWGALAACVSKKKSVTPTTVHAFEEFAKFERIDNEAMYYGLA